MECVLHAHKWVRYTGGIMKYLLFGIGLFSVLFSPVYAQEVHQDLKETVPATVLEVLSEEEREIMGSETTALVQELRVRIEGGAREGETAVFTNDLVELEPGDSIFVNRLVGIDDSEWFEFKDADRRGSLLWLAAFFVTLLILFAGKQGLRALLSLLGSVLAILFILVPLLLKGYPPVLTSIGVAGVILALVLFGTHGINARATTAFLGTMSAVLVTGLVATVWVTAAQFTGFGSDAAVYLNFGTHGQLDFVGLLLGSMLIGVLGVLDDVAITQSSVVRELKAANNTLAFMELYRRAIRVGRDHVGSLVNTLALAYIGVALPLVLLMAQANSDFMLAVNQEIVAAELVRILVGSIGLILAVPLTTAIAAWWFGRKEEVEVSAEGHGHTHG